MKMYFVLIFISIVMITFLYKRLLLSKKARNKKLVEFKNSFTSKEKNIQKIYLRENEKKSQNPNINISINHNDSEEMVKNKINLHRSRLAKFKRSMLNEELIYLDKNNKVYKYIGQEKIYV